MMDKKDILKKVGGILAELNDQYEYLSQNVDNLSELELELFSANANFLSDHLAILIKLNGVTSKKLEVPNSELGTDKVVEADEPVTNTSTAAEGDETPVAEADSGLERAGVEASGGKFEGEKEPGLAFDFTEKGAEELYDRPMSQDETKLIDEETSLKPADVEEEEYIAVVAPDKKAVDETIITTEAPKVDENVHLKEVVISERTIAVPLQVNSETNDRPVVTVNDLLSKNVSQQTLANQFHSTQNKDLKSMISLNDKLLFVRDLFNGYSLAYSEAIELINRFDSFEAADNFLKQNYSSKNHWSEKQDVADKFYQILNRRFLR